MLSSKPLVGKSMSTPARPTAKRATRSPKPKGESVNAAIKLQAHAPEAQALRQRILDISRELLDSDGVAALSMREVARRAGVTHQAPYHHFSDRQTILAELVFHGFDEMARRLAEANDLAESQGRPAAVQASCMAYVGFALEQPGVFGVMFRPDVCDPARFPQAREAGQRAHGELLRLVSIAHGAVGNDEHVQLASLYWAHVHGLACLLIDGPLGQAFPDRAARIRHADDVSRRFVEFVIGTSASHAAQ